MMAEYQRPENIVRLAGRLASLGYWPVPIPAGCKGPTVAGWQNLRLSESDVENYFSESGMLVGILHNNVLALDIDVYDKDLADAIIAEGLRRFPGALERVGQAPKSALFLRMSEPGFKVGNTGKFEKDGKSAQVEVRSVTRQIVAYGIHPDTGKPYRWPRGELWATPWEELPEAKREDVEQFRDWCDDKIKRWAGVSDPKIIDLGLQFGRQSLDEKPSVETFRQALSYVPANVGYEDWLSGLMGIHDFYNGSHEGLECAKQWSASYPDYSAHEVETKWKSFEAGKGTTYRSVLYLAKQNGADLSEMARKERAANTFEIATQVTQTAAEPQHSDEDKPTWPTPLTRFDEASLPRRKWVYGTCYIRNYVSVVASAGGIGKTSLAIVEALAICTGKPLLGEAVKEMCNAWVINLEDPREEMEMRTLAAMKFHGIKPEDVRGKLFMDGEDDISITLAAESRDGLILNDALLAHIRDKIIENEIGVVIIDPFVSTHLVNENSNASVQAVVAMFRSLARQTGAAICLVHHVRKGNGEDASVDSVRGAGSLIGAARSARVINRVSQDEAERLGVHPKDAKGIFRVDDGKANLAPPAEEAVYRKMEGVQLANEEWVGVATKFDLPDEWAGMTDAIVNDILRLIDKGPKRDDDTEEYFSIRPQDKTRWVGQVIMDYPFPKAEDFKTEGQAKAILRQWLKNGLLEEISYHSAAQRKERKGICSTGRVGEQK